MAEQTPDPALEDERGRRGALVLKDRVVERIVTLAALEVAGVTRHATGLDRVTGRDLPRASVELAGDHARASVDVAVVWPCPLSATSAAVRARVAEQLGALGGLTVDAVDVTVTTVPQPSATPRTRRVQ